ncbi:hypothetical protein JX265_004511 [Neoarthrinium moseri]|uniref:Uncharacterized protein n=1 Tax=Neoarthrinium moseri TaxID=1658444 RepID=A0A9P9WR30_9PEZI|nr:hypothetical protein JX265_004511 [Neoarthrinium moseri]
MTGPRLTAPAAKLARSISTTSSASAVPAASTLFTSSKAAAPLMRKYADLLKERNLDGDHSRHIYTRSANRPHPPPQHMRLMQTFSTTSTPAAKAEEKSHMDYAVLPSFESLATPGPDSASRLRVPLLPDNFVARHVPEAADEPLPMPEINVLAADPDAVSVSAFTEVEGMTLDGVELKFAHDPPAKEQEPGMLKDLWKGLVDDVLGGSRNGGKLAV